MSNNSLKLKKGLGKRAHEFLKYLIENGGPDIPHYNKFTSLVNNLDQLEIGDFRETINTILNANTLIGHAFVKPLGYSGDFNLIYKIYQFEVNQYPRYKNWDLFFQNQPTAYAVRNSSS
jgi:extracellular factor (EF) 3-hydroxypalmitic acid methyl ester biosynthesis protein